MSKRPISVLVLVHAPGQRILMLNRVGADGFWQSVTGALEDGESPRSAACRELLEETGLRPPPDRLVDWALRNRFPIPPRWRSRYASGVYHNTEHLFSVEVSEHAELRLSPAEHGEARWVDAREALQLAWSWTNRDAIRLLQASWRSR